MIIIKHFLATMTMRASAMLSKLADDDDQKVSNQHVLATPKRDDSLGLDSPSSLQHVSPIESLERCDAVAGSR